MASTKILINHPYVPCNGKATKQGEAMQYPFEEGVVLAATKQIIENDVPHDPEAKGCEPGWRHASLGDIGVVVGVHDPDKEYPQGKPTVRFMNSETATMVFENEVIFMNYSKDLMVKKDEEKR